MARHACVSRWDAGKGGFLHRSVAVTAVDPIVRDMMFVTKRNGLLQRDTDLRGIGRPINGRSGPTSSTDQDDQPENSDASVNVRAFRKNLGHGMR
jgi:hypothetical protein